MVRVKLLHYQTGVGRCIRLQLPKLVCRGAQYDDLRISKPFYARLSGLKRYEATAGTITKYKQNIRNKYVFLSFPFN